MSTVRPSSREVSLSSVIGTAGGPRKSHRIWLYCIPAAGSDNGSEAFQVNHIAAVVLRDDVHNDGGSRTSHWRDFQGRPQLLSCKFRKIPLEVFGGLRRFSERIESCKSHVFARWTDMTVDCSFSSHIYSGKNLTSVTPHYSPASVHSSSDPRNRCTLPGQVRSWEDCSLRSYYSPANRACAWGVRRPCYVPHPRARLSDQERIRPIQQIPPRSEDGSLLRRNTDAKGH